MVVAFRKALGERIDKKEDNQALTVYGHEEVYELVERCKLEHPDAKDQVPWPQKSDQWASLQNQDENIKRLIETMQSKIENEGMIRKINIACL